MTVADSQFLSLMIFIQSLYYSPCLFEEFSFTRIYTAGQQLRELASYRAGIRPVKNLSDSSSAVLITTRSALYQSVDRRSVGSDLT